MTVKVLFLFLAVPWAGLQLSIVAFPGHTHISFVSTVFGFAHRGSTVSLLSLNACVFLAVPRVGLQCWIVACPGRTHISFVSAVFSCAHRGSTVSLLPYECLCLPRGATGRSAVLDCGSTWSYSHKLCVCSFSLSPSWFNCQFAAI